MKSTYKPMYTYMIIFYMKKLLKKIKQVCMGMRAAVRAIKLGEEKGR